MCAINGITKKDLEFVTRMNLRTRHRGPDGTHIWEGEGVTLGHNRLAIIDTSDSSSQPMQSNDGRYVIVYNGELYNFRELRDELKGNYIFKTVGDTEVLLAAYVCWGSKMFSKLRGIFAFGIWDTKTKELILARDHMGVKPLYYQIQGDVLIFSSEIPALLSGESTAQVDRESLAFYLSMEYVPGPATLVKGIQKLQPGHVLTFRQGVYSCTSFKDADMRTRACTQDDIYNSIDKAVQRQLISDRPVGAYLSGGFDSSIVVHHMKKHVQNVRTYSVDFESVRGEESDSRKFNIDAELAERTAQFYGTEHKKLTIGIKDVQDVLESAIAGSSEPIANATAITQYLLSDFVRKDGTVVVLGGDGGDELFAGYTRHRLAMGAYIYQSFPKSLQKVGGVMYPRLGKLSTPFFTPLHMALMVKDEKKIRPFLKKPIQSNVQITQYFDALYKEELDRDLRHPLDVFMSVDRSTWLADECFIRSDYASMAHGLELRVPLVDIDVVTCANNISIWKKVLPHQGKRILRATYESYLPHHLYNQPKRGWLSPAAKWFRDPVIGSFVREVLSSSYYSGLDDIFDWEQVRSLLDEHINKKGYYLYPLWNILVLQIWAQKNNLR